MSKKKWTQKDLEKLFTLRDVENRTWEQLTEDFPGVTANALRKAYYNTMRKEAPAPTAPKVLILDIETTPIISYTWGLFDQNVALNQVIEDWSILSWAAKWLDSDKVFYSDTRNEKNPRNDKNLLKEIWKLLDQADIVVGQNSTAFDIKKLNARFILNGMNPPSSFRQIDTMRIAKRHFKFTSNKLEYMSKNLCEEHVKLTQRQFNGFDLWKACLAKNTKAFQELEAYNIEDVLATEELLKKLMPWNKSINFDVYNESFENICTCGNSRFSKKGYVYSNLAKYERFVCTKCGKEHVSRENLLSKEKRKSLKK
jgi:hypothetical protein